jgi:hypothetical protein
MRQEVAGRERVDSSGKDTQEVMALRSAPDILNHFETWALDQESRAYLHYHVRRYEFLLQTIDETIACIQHEMLDHPLRVLDIGPGFQTEICRRTLPEAIVNTLGFRDPRFHPRSQDRHFQFDLNDAQYPEKWPRLERHHLVVMAEVIEHLYTFPGLVLRCASTWLVNGGYLIIQTPNACALHKRLRMLMGRHPYDMIREGRENPGHFREYTLDELASLVGQSGLRPVSCTTRNYFDQGTLAHGIYNAAAGLLPMRLRQGITMTILKEAQGAKTEVQRMPCDLPTSKERPDRLDQSDTKHSIAKAPCHQY